MMDIQQVNSVLTRAIVGFQEGEVQAMAEAMAATPEDYGWMNPGVTTSAAPAGSRELPRGLVRRLLQLKMDVPFVKSVAKRREGPRATDLDVRLRGGGRLDMRVGPDAVLLAGGRGKVRVRGRSAPQVYSDVVRFVGRYAGRSVVAEAMAGAHVDESVARGRTHYRVPVPDMAVRVKKITVAQVKRALKKDDFSLSYRDKRWFIRSAEVSPGIDFIEKKFNGKPVRYEYDVSAYGSEGRGSLWGVSLKDAVAWANKHAQAAADAVVAETGRMV